MQSYPSEEDRMYHGPRCHPGMETIPSQGYVNPVRPPMGYGYWPWGSSYCGASPIACHGCCNHSYFPAHGAWGSPYSHVTAHHWPGNYPSFPVQYMPPPQYYPNTPGEHHCCGCLNHPPHHKEQKNVRIEEEEPEREKRKDGSVVPYEVNNSPYPIAWLPPDYSGNKEGSRGVKAQQKDSPYPIVWLPTDYSSNKEQGMVKKGEDAPDVKANENGKVAAQQPTFQSGWLPLDLNNLVLPKHKEDGERSQHDDGKRNFPYPLFWIPHKHEEKEKDDQKEKNVGVKPSLESEMGSSDGEQRFHLNKGSIGDRAAKKARDIPVKEAEQLVEKETSTNKEKERDTLNKESIGDRAAKKARDIPVKEAEQHVERETSTNKEKQRDTSDVLGKENGNKVSPKEGSKRKSSTPPKSSKLPPVCLRVDPLPKRKNGDESSQSSPPCSKQKLDSHSHDASKVLPLGKKEQAKIPPNEHMEDKSTKIIKVVDGKTSEGNNTMDVKIDNPIKDAVESHADASTNEVESAQIYTNNDAVTKDQSKDTGLAGENNEVSFQAQDMKAEEAEKSCITRLSEEEAAVIIQSAYRGFDVRRWELINKLKQIAEVREQIADVKHLIQAMKSSFDIEGRSKQRNIVAETIMSLLLKLDTIQGLTPSLREVRKSVVKELVSLQEQLDSLMNELEKSLGPEAVTPRDEDASQNECETTPTEGHQDQTSGGSSNRYSKTSEADLIGEQASEEMEKEAAGSCMDRGVELAPEATIREGQKSNEVLINDEMAAEKDQEDTNNGNSETSDADLTGEQASEKIEKEATTSCIDKGVESAAEPAIRDVEKSKKVLVSDETIHEDLVLEQGSGIPLQEDSSSTKATDITAINDDMVVSELTELPIGVADDFYAEEGPNGVLAEADVAQEKQQPVRALIESSSVITEPHETADSSQPVETHEVPDHPFNMVNVEPDSEETCPIERLLDDCKPDDKFEIEEVDGKPEDARIEPDYYTLQQLQNFNAHMIEASDEIGDHHTARDNETPSHLLQVPNSMQETSFISESANSDEAIGKIIAEAKSDDRGIDSDGAEAKSDDKRIDSDSSQQSIVAEERQSQISEASQQDDQVSVNVPEECNTKQPTPTKALEVQGSMDAASVEDSPARDEVTESNRRLSEENERLRNMMEKLIKSGQEQLLAISSLSGRVKDLEKRLSRKKNMKVKQYRAPRAGSSCMTKYDGADDKRTVEDVM